MKKIIILSFIFTLVLSGCAFQKEKVDKVGNVLGAVVLRSEVEFPEEEPGRDFIWKTEEGKFLLAGRGFEYLDENPAENRSTLRVLGFFNRYGFKLIRMNTVVEKDIEVKVWAHMQEGVGCLTTHSPYDETEDNADDALLEVRCGMIEEGVLQEKEAPEEDVSAEDAPLEDSEI